MQAEIMMIGSELLLGQIEDTNSTYLGQILAENGVNLYQKTTVGDNIGRLTQALNNALSRSDVVICSGGLGPTEDDLTRESVAEVFGRELEYHEDIFEHIEMLFARYQIKLTENNKKQAMVPKGAIVIDNPNGTAPGLIVDDEKGIIICMPGVPRELKAMMQDSVLPFLRKRFDLSAIIHSRVLKICGVGESSIDAAIGDLIAEQSNPTVGVLASPAAVRIRITAKADTLEGADKLIDEIDAEVRKRLPGLVMGVNEDTIESVLDALLAQRRWRMAVVESSTGGMIGQRLTTANATQFAGGRVIAVNIDLASEKRLSIALARKFMLDCEAECGLAVLCDSAAGITEIGFVSPEGEREWTIGRAGTAETMQVRTSIVSLEHVRRHLEGIE